MNDLDTRIREALDRDAERAPEPPATWTGPVLATSPRDASRRSRTLVGSVAAGSIVVAGVAAMAWWSPSGTSPSIQPGATPAPPATTISAAEEEALRAEAVREAEQRRSEAVESRRVEEQLADVQRRVDAERSMLEALEEFADTVAVAGAGLGWNLPRSDIRPTNGSIESDPTPDGTSARFVEVRADDPDIAGELLVSARTGDADAVTAGRNGHREPLTAAGSTEVHLGVDSDTARAVELFDLDSATIVYVRSESSDARARPVGDLITLALDIAARTTN